MITFQRQISKNIKHLRTFSNSTFLATKKDGDDGKTTETTSQIRQDGEEKTSDKDKVTRKLNDLLKVMLQNEDVQPKKEVQLAQAVKRTREKPEKEKSLGEKIAGAAKDVATSLGGNVEKTQSDLLNILLRRSESSTQILKDVLTGIKVEKSADPASRAQQVRDNLSQQMKASSEQLFDSRGQKMGVKKPMRMTAARVDILGAKPSSYFKNLQPQPAPCELRTWQSCVDRDLRLAITHPPNNIYEQMIQWTDRGMFWHFPINNEQGLDDEKKVSFEEHIFLENHLEGWCPERGPIRNFMEVVCVGLSKNHWLTAEEKKSYIMWFRDYFAERKTLINELGAGPITFEAKNEQEISK